MISSQPYTRLLDNLSTAILFLDEGLRLSHINAAAEVLLELSGARHCGEHIAELLNNGSTVAQSLAEILASGQPSTQREAVLQPLNGKPATVDYTVTPSDDLPGSALIIEIQPIDRLLRISREETLFSSQASTRALLKGMAHEIKNPLGGLRGAAQLLEGELGSEELREYTQIIIDESDRLRNLVDRMLTPTQAQERDATNIHEVLERVRQLIDAESNGRIKFVRDFDPSIPDLLADRESLIQAALNITRNAMQALDNAGTSDPCITLRTRILRQFTIGTQCHKLVCKVDVADNGPGIPSELTDSLFFPMVSGSANSSGLGLSISQSIVNQHQGLIAFDSAVGDTCFTMFLPLEAQS